MSLPLHVSSMPPPLMLRTLHASVVADVHRWSTHI
jgi:hypothetical protein